MGAKSLIPTDQSQCAGDSKESDKVSTVSELPHDVHLSNDEITRYSRHLLIPEFGIEGQKKLKQASVLIVGAGGLGSPVAMYLAAAGIGKLGIVEYDTVDGSNLQRQLLYRTSDIGRPKAEAAKDTIKAINPFVDVQLYSVPLTSRNALEIFSGYDVIVDGSDNFPTRYLVSDACVMLHKPNVYGSIFRFEGQVSIFHAEKGACYRCLYPEPPPPDLVPSCAEAGVLGVLPGIIGSLQAIETIKLITGIGEPLLNRLLLFDALRMKFQELRLGKNPDCAVCSDHPKITALIDYEHFCGMPSHDRMEHARQSPLISDALHEITAEELKARLDRGERPFLLDVRTAEEVQICRLEGAVLIPVRDLSSRLGELPGDQSTEIITICKVGTRSAEAAEILMQNGFTNVNNLLGGLDEWAKHIDLSMPRY
ncbi:MAG: molybdopterin-synthase adenylyltransferase MoeB [Chlorobiales bacterium]|jgi:sulfur-carrier protein adenylyltransferase/sulfurtransferase|nr:molybdopterin-synthase adenylyltransferase MoeB [Chlorobiales bacterium]